MAAMVVVLEEDGWPRSTRSGRNVPTVPLGDREEMIHFQHRFTQDDLITLCEWTVPGREKSAGFSQREACRMRHYTLLRCLCIDYGV